jgi:hypothetical protein
VLEERAPGRVERRGVVPALVGALLLRHHAEVARRLLVEEEQVHVIGRRQVELAADGAGEEHAAERIAPTGRLGRFPEASARPPHDSHHPIIRSSMNQAPNCRR